jgi:hypothetical protein
VLRQVVVEADHAQQAVTGTVQAVDLLADHVEVVEHRAGLGAPEQVDVPGHDGERGPHLVRGEPDQALSAGDLFTIALCHLLVETQCGIPVTDVPEHQPQQQGHERDLGRLRPVDVPVGGAHEEDDAGDDGVDGQTRVGPALAPYVESERDGQPGVPQVVGDRLPPRHEPHGDGARRAPGQPGHEEVQVATHVSPPRSSSRRRERSPRAGPRAFRAACAGTPRPRCCPGRSPVPTRRAAARPCGTRLRAGA